MRSNVPYLRDFLSLQFLKSGSPTLSNYLIEEYVPGLWVTGINGLNLMIVDNLSRNLLSGIFRQNTEFIAYHKFILRVISIYTHLNMLVLPLIGYGSDSSWSLLAGLFSWRKAKTDFIYGNSCRPN